MIDKRFVGSPVWRIAPSSTAPVFLNRLWVGSTTDGLPANFASVCSKGRRSAWAAQPMTIFAKDLFPTKAEALVEYRRRRAAALQANPLASLRLRDE
jgi:hypothetical protein